MGAPLGNQNGAKAKRWSAAIERALERRAGARTPQMDEGRSPSVVALDEAADLFVMRLFATGDLAFFREFGDRMEGKVVQALEHGNTGGVPFVVRLTPLEAQA